PPHHPQRGATRRTDGPLPPGSTLGRHRGEHRGRPARAQAGAPRVVDPQSPRSDARNLESAVRRRRALEPAGQRDHRAATAPPRSGSSRVRVAIARLDGALPLPRYAREGDAGLDLHAARDIALGAGERALVETGIAVAIPLGWAGFVLPRSG